MKFTIVKSQTIKSPRLDRAGMMDRWIIYTTDGGASGSVTLPEETFTDDALVEAVRVEEAKHDAHRGREFTL